MWADCDRTCKGCCNKDWDLEALPTCETYQGYETIMLTGGEPMLKPDVILDTVSKIRSETDAQIIVYTAKVDKIYDSLDVLYKVDGMTLTLHTKPDIAKFLAFDDALVKSGITGKSLRLNVFKNVEKYFTLTDDQRSRWRVQGEMVWLKNCPLPKNEVFQKAKTA